MTYVQRPRRLRLAAALFACFVALWAAAPAGSEELAGELDGYVRKAAAEAGFNGAVLVARGGKVLLEEGYGWADLKKTARVGRGTRFYVASITKQFTAAAVLRLEEQGRLRTDDAIGKYLADVPPDKAAVTIHQLLTHTSGLAQAYAADGISDRAEAVRALLKAPLKSPPGAQFRYTNDGYNLLAVIVEVASGQTYEEYLRRHLLRPAGMSQTGFWGDAHPTAATLREIGADVRRPNWGFRGATGMTSTVGDLYKWHRALGSGKVLKPTARAKLLTPYVNTPRGGYGYGWFTSEAKGLKVVWTSGAEDFGHNAIIKTYADGTVVIVASNAGTINGAMARDFIGNGLEGIIFGGHAPDSPRRRGGGAED
jgi:CubicO group peptidase (beta-lactamase class C family)